jgi:hypothetical protein
MSTDTSCKMSEPFSNFVRKRGIIKARITRFSNHLDDVESSSEVLSEKLHVELKLRLRTITSLYAEFDSLQTQIEEMVSESELGSQLSQRDSFEDSYYNVLTRAECILGNEMVTGGSKFRDTQQAVKLPTISIPTFEGDYEHWLEFRDTFMSLIHNSNSISDIQKFHYLKSSLKGSASLVLESLEFSTSNYAIAWDLLLNRYNNSNLLIHNHIKAIFSTQKLTKESPMALRLLIDTILKKLGALKLLGEPTDSWDTLIILLLPN